MEGISVLLLFLQIRHHKSYCIQEKTSYNQTISKNRQINKKKRETELAINVKQALAYEEVYIYLLEEAFNNSDPVSL